MMKEQAAVDVTKSARVLCNDFAQTFGKSPNNEFYFRLYDWLLFTLPLDGTQNRCPQLLNPLASLRTLLVDAAGGNQSGQ